MAFLKFLKKTFEKRGGERNGGDSPFKKGEEGGRVWHSNSRIFPVTLCNRAFNLSLYFFFFKKKCRIFLRHVKSRALPGSGK